MRGLNVEEISRSPRFGGLSSNTSSQGLVKVDSTNNSTSGLPDFTDIESAGSK